MALLSITARLSPDKLRVVGNRRSERQPNSHIRRVNAGNNTPLSLSARIRVPYTKVLGD
jgi:hypothetical protein